MKQNNLTRIVLIMVSSFLIACGEGNREKAFKDIEVKDSVANADIAVLPETADAVKIGNQVWANKNLNVTEFNNGDAINEAKSEEEWEKAGAEGRPAWCYYNNDSAFGAVYGKLYNWYAVNDPRKLAPKNWHIASDMEWTVLANTLGGDDIAGVKLKSDSGWADKGNGSNTNGFSALPGGYRYFAGFFFNAGLDGGWWTSTADGKGYSWLRYIYSKNVNLFRNHSDPKFGFSVRCIKD
jgi:uncharacterized protein (TIGR02145 family)